MAAGLPSYECSLDTVLGQTYCQVTAAMQPLIGEGGLGTPCVAGPTLQCRSTLCAAIESSAAYCVEICTVRGGCPQGFGCLPLRASGSPYSLYCVSAGRGDLGDPCTDNTDCRSAYCDASRCTRICNDGYCPSEMTCSATGITAGGTAIRVCR